MIVESKSPKQKESIVARSYYYKKENKKLLRLYGHQIFQYSKILDQGSSFPDCLKNHKVDSKFRTRLVDWMFEVFNATSCSETTIYLTFYLFDSFLFRYKEKIIVNDDLQLLAVTCLFISSKHEDIAPIFMHNLRVTICHNRFQTKEIKEMERLVMRILNFGTITHNIGEFIRGYFYEFKTTNRSNFLTQEQEENFKEMEIFAIYISMVILHSEFFSTYKSSIKSIACIVIAFEIVRTQKKMTLIEEELMKKWILSLMEESQFDPDDINSLYNKVADFYSNFQSLSIAHNLQKSTDLPY